MNRNKQGLVIAEACPFVEKHGKFELLWRVPDGRRVYFDPLNDLNAMRSVEDTLTERQREMFAHVLTDVVGGDEVRVPDPDRYIQYVESPADFAFKVMHATAEKRAEAFLRTIGKWEADDDTH